MIKVSNFELDHLTLIEGFGEILEAYRDCPEALNWYSNGPAYTMHDDQGIICMGGLCLQGGGLALAWMVPTPRIKEVPIYVTKLAKWIIRTGLDDLGIRKIFAYVASDDQTAIRWAKIVGLQKEAFLRKHNYDGKDVYLFSIIREE